MKPNYTTSRSLVSFIVRGKIEGDGEKGEMGGELLLRPCAGHPILVAGGCFLETKGCIPFLSARARRRGNGVGRTVGRICRF